MGVAMGAARRGVGAALHCVGLVLLGSALPSTLARAEPHDALPEEPTAREIYEGFLSNRHRSAIIRMTVVSDDRNGEPQEAELFVRFRDYRENNLRPPDGGVISKTFVRVERPEAHRRITYLVVGRVNQPRDEFLYMPEWRRTRRFRLRGFGLLGTRVTVDDLLFQSIDDATYERLPDEEVSGVPTYVVRATLHDYMRTDYRHAIAYIAKRNSVLMRAVYQDPAGFTLREMRANPESIEEREGIWIANEITILDPLTQSSTRLSIDTLAANAALAERAFSAFELWHHRD